MNLSSLKVPNTNTLNPISTAIGALFLWISWANFLVAQTQLTGSISGRVYDRDDPKKAGLADATVSLTDQETDVRRVLLTNDNGEYFFDLLPPSRYQLTCRLDGYENLSGTEVNIQVFIATRREVKVPPFELRRVRVPGATPARPSAAARLMFPPRLWSAGLRLASLDGTEMRPFSRFLLPVLGEVPLDVYPDDTELSIAQTTQLPSSPQPPAPSKKESGAMKLVSTLGATRGGTFTESQLMSLPLEGIRTFDALALLLPGVVGPPQTVSSTVGPGVGSSVGTAGQFSVNGLRSRGNNFVVDGSDNNDEDIGVRRQGFTALVPQPIESVKQFQVSTLLPEPQFGRNLGGQANVVSRSGGAAFHGMVYGLFTDKRLNARNFFDLQGEASSRFLVTRSALDPTPVFLDGESLTQPNPSGGENPFTRSQAGFVLGGPLKPQKTHLFASFEHQDVNASRESHFAVPVVAQRGLFESGATGLESKLRIADQEFRRIFYPTTAFGDAVFSLFPWPNNPLGPYGANTRTEILPADADGVVFSLKADHRWKAFGRENSFSARYNFNNDHTVLPVTGGALFSTLQTSLRTQNFSIFVDTMLSNLSSNQARFSYGRTRMTVDDYPTGLHGQRSVQFQDPNDQSFLLSAPLVYNFTAPLLARQPTAYLSYASLKQAGFTGLPDVNGTEAITGPVGQVLLSGFSSLGIDVFNFPQQRVNNTFQFADTVITNRSKLHRLTAGFDLRRSQLNSFLDRNSRSQLVFSGAPNLNQTDGKPNELFSQGQVLSNHTPTDSSFRGTDFVSVAAPTGFFQTLRAPAAFGTIGLRYWQIDLFLADQLRLAQNFSLILGLRYGLNTVPVEVNHRIEASFQSPEVHAFIAAEKQQSLQAGEVAVSGLEVFLDGRTKIFNPDRNNLGPYAAFAWDPFNRGKTSLRGGIGLYYDQIPGAVISQSRNVFPNFLTLNLGGYRANPASPADRFPLAAVNPHSFAVLDTLDLYDTGGKYGSDLVSFMIDTALRTNYGSGPAFILPSARLKTPQALHWALNLEQEVRGNLLLSLAYVGTQGRHLLRFATPNLGPNVIPTVLEVTSRPGSIEPLFQGTTVAPGTELINLGGRLATGGRPFPLLGSFTSIESDADSSYHALQVQASRRLVSGWQFTAAYTWSHAIDEVSDLFDLAGVRSLPQNSFDRRAERGSASFDVRHRLAASFVWDLPVFRKNKWLGGWQVAGIASVQTGQPFTVIGPFDMNQDGNLTDRLDGRLGFQEVNRDEVRFEWDDPMKQIAQLGSAGHEGRNTFQAPGLGVLDLAAGKRFQLKENTSVELRTEFFNLLNRSHFGMPVHQVGFPAFGRSTSTLVPSRVIQFALRFSF